MITVTPASGPADLIPPGLLWQTTRPCLPSHVALVGPGMASKVSRARLRDVARSGFRGSRLSVLEKDGPRGVSGYPRDVPACDLACSFTAQTRDRFQGAGMPSRRMRSSAARAPRTCAPASGVREVLACTATQPGPPSSATRGTPTALLMRSEEGRWGHSFLYGPAPGRHTGLFGVQVAEVFLIS